MEALTTEGLQAGGRDTHSVERLFQNVFAFTLVFCEWKTERNARGQGHVIGVGQEHLQYYLACCDIVDRLHSDSENSPTLPLDELLSQPNPQLRTIGPKNQYGTSEACNHSMARGP